MGIDDLKKNLQSHFSDGLVIIVGSGLSCAEGMPGMGELASHIIEKSAESNQISTYPNWRAVCDSILQEGLEAALLKYQLPPEIEKEIMSLTADFLLESENNIIEEVLSGKKTLRVTRLLPHVLKPPKGVPIIITNYDRLVEIAAEVAGLGINTLFCGNYIGSLKPTESHYAHCRGVKIVKKSVQQTFCRYVNIYKPHGSLDWYQGETEAIRYPSSLSLPRLIITPGVNKFRNGYESPFDKHREEANRAIGQAKCFLIIGYGFNDDHLETHLRLAIRSGKATVLITRTISDNAVTLLKDSPNFIALEQSSNNNGTRLLSKDHDIEFSDINMWDLNNFISEVFEP